MLHALALAISPHRTRRAPCVPARRVHGFAALLLALALAACAAPSPQAQAGADGVTDSGTAAGSESETRPPPPAPPAPAAAYKSDAEVRAGMPAAPDRSCRSDSDCAVKDVGNCCGYFPMCVNKNAQTDPAAVRAACEREGIASICGFEEVKGCRCVDNRCENLRDGLPEAM